MAFYPLYLERTSQFFVEVAYNGEIVDIVRLHVWSVIFGDHECNAVDGEFGYRLTIERCIGVEDPSAEPRV